MISVLIIAYAIWDLRHYGRDWEKLYSRWSDEPKYTANYLYQIPLQDIFAFLNLLCSANLYIPSILSFVVFISLYITLLIIFRFTYILNCSIVLSSCLCSRSFASLLSPCICCLFVSYLHRITIRITLKWGLMLPKSHRLLRCISPQ